MSGTPATSAAGEQAIVDWLKTRGIVLPELVIGNGSGLSREARITPDGMAKVLVGAYESRFAPEFLTSLSLGGLDGTLQKRFRNLDDPSRVRMKTGTLKDVSAIAGYVTGKSGKVYAVVVFVNHPGAQNGPGEAIHSTIVDWVLKQ
jgi:D-alanyl-D-alanine carboxypeptidase/D-alanyl-D-alanine-endopeptidase (penicillin-binding protein 4)